MMRTAFALCFVLLALPLSAAELEAGIRHLHMSPMGEGAYEGGELDVVASRGFAATAEVFWSPRLSTQFAVTFLNPAAFVFPDAPPPDDVDLGTLGMELYSAAARWHFAPEARFSPFAGAGVALATFGNLEDRFGDDIEMEFGNELAPLIEGGVRYRVHERIFLDAAVTYMRLEATTDFVRNDTDVPLPDRVSPDPLIVSVGASWRF